MPSNSQYFLVRFGTPSLGTAGIMLNLIEQVNEPVFETMGKKNLVGHSFCNYILDN